MSYRGENDSSEESGGEESDYSGEESDYDEEQATSAKRKSAKRKSAPNKRTAPKNKKGARGSGKTTRSSKKKKKAATRGNRKSDAESVLKEPGECVPIHILNCYFYYRATSLVIHLFTQHSCGRGNRQNNRFVQEIGQ